MRNVISAPESLTLPAAIEEELNNYEQQIRQYLAGELNEIKMQKLRLHFGTYAQRQEGVQMQRIKIPGGLLSADQLTRLADAADSFGSGFLHFTTREDAQIYYVKLEETPALLRFLAAGGITTREACGNTVRNITACYRAGTSATEVFNVWPYAEALFRYLVRNKYNQNLGRKFKIAFEGCAGDHCGLRIHDIGLAAVTQTRNGKLRRGFRVFLGGGLGAAPHLAHLYTEFLPVEELFNLAASALRLFDRYGERKARMKARMKFLIETLGWETFRAALDEERKLVGPVSLEGYLQQVDEPALARQASDTQFRGLPVLDQRTSDSRFQSWVRDSVIAHKREGFRGVHVRIKLGDLTAERARGIADVARRFSLGQLRISIEQNLYLPWVPSDQLPDLYLALGELSLAERGAGTIADVTTCPGSDTCRLGIASAKGLGSALSKALEEDSNDPIAPIARYAELVRPLRIKISGCPNGCAQHSIANIGFYAAALSHEEHAVPAYFVTVGGRAQMDKAQFGSLLGKFPARSCVQVTETLLRLYEKERLPGEEFNSFIGRTGTERLKQILEPLRQIPAFTDQPAFYEDYGHEHESFAVRKGIKGECAGSTVAEIVPTIEAAREALAQAEAFLYHREYESAALTAYEAAAAGARVPLYQRLIDPFNADEALWEFENVFVLSGETQGEWSEVSNRFAGLKQHVRQTSVCRVDTTEASFEPNRQTEVCRTPEAAAQEILSEARKFVGYIAQREARSKTAVAEAIA